MNRLLTLFGLGGGTLVSLSLVFVFGKEIFRGYDGPEFNPPFFCLSLFFAVLGAVQGYMLRKIFVRGESIYVRPHPFVAWMANAILLCIIIFLIICCFAISRLR